MTARRRVVRAVTFSVALLGAAANSQDVIKSCPVLDVYQVKVSEERAPAPTSARAELDALPAQRNRKTPTRALETAVTVVALGPVLGFKDSSQVLMHWACSDKGVILSAIITRRSDLPNATLGTTLRGRYPWRPRLTISAVLRQPTATFQAIWKMRLTDGKEVEHAGTPPYPDQKYPIIVQAMLHGRKE